MVPTTHDWSVYIYYIYIYNHVRVIFENNYKNQSPSILQNKFK